MNILKGSDIVTAMNIKMKEELKQFPTTLPHLAIIRIGERPDDLSYERGAKKRMETIGLRCSTYSYPENITDKEFKPEFASINSNNDIDGILLLRPLPKHIDEKAIEAIIDPAKDVDGISPVNMAKIFAGDSSGFAPCTAEAVIEILEYSQIPLTGKRVVIVGRSLVVGKPLALLLIQKNCTITVCHTKTVDLPTTCKNAEILIACAGRAKMLNSSYIGSDAVVIDVGINMDENNKLCGDVDLESISSIASLATPVPGGVGTVTTSVLAKHTIQSAKRRRTISGI